MSAPERDLMQDLREQLDFLDSSAAAFDSGRWHEAKRLAVTLRVLLQDHGGTSLLTQMGVRDKLRWLASGGGVDPTNLLPTQSLTSMAMGRFIPLYPDEILTTGRLVAFETWWATPVIKDAQGAVYARRDLIGVAANRDGGAHVGRLRPGESGLATGASVGWRLRLDSDPDRDLLFGELIPASIRTITDEVRATLGNQHDIVGLPRD